VLAFAFERTLNRKLLVLASSASGCWCCVSGSAWHWVGHGQAHVAGTWFLASRPGMRQRVPLPAINPLPWLPWASHCCPIRPSRDCGTRAALPLVANTASVVAAVRPVLAETSAPFLTTTAPFCPTTFGRHVWAA